MNISQCAKQPTVDRQSRKPYKRAWVLRNARANEAVHKEGSKRGNQAKRGMNHRPKVKVSRGNQANKRDEPQTKSKAQRGLHKPATPKGIPRFPVETKSSKTGLSNQHQAATKSSVFTAAIQVTPEGNPRFSAQKIQRTRTNCQKVTGAIQPASQRVNPNVNRSSETPAKRHEIASKRLQQNSQGVPFETLLGFSVLTK